jgi:hypothetical protein
MERVERGRERRGMERGERDGEGEGRRGDGWSGGR